MLQLLLLAVMAGNVLAGDFTVKIRPRQTNSYPTPFEIPTLAETPQEWMDALAAAQAAGKIPNIALAQLVNGNPVYANNAGFDSSTCSWTVTKCTASSDIVNAPPHQMAIGFDDGPTQNSGDLYGFLSQVNQSATHYMIGSNVYSYPQQFAQAVAEGNQHFAVHTWSHNLCTSLTNQQLVAELGWTMQIIADKSGGYIPKFWRPPQGDIDNRVRAIAEEIFGLTNVLWNHDTNDWCLQDDGTSACPNEDPGKDYASVAAAASAGINGPQQNGLIMLEHELTHQSIKVFKDYYPLLKGLGWTPNNVADVFDMPWYKNAWDNAQTPKNGSVLDSFNIGASPYPDDSSNSTTTSAPSSSATGSTSSSAPSSTHHASTRSGSAAAPQKTSKQSVTTSGAAVFGPASFGVAGLASIAAVITCLL